LPEHLSLSEINVGIKSGRLLQVRERGEGGGWSKERRRKRERGSEEGPWGGG
jgi:hypothetical protein